MTTLEKIQFVKHEYTTGRLQALLYYVARYQSFNEIDLLLNYENFGEGDMIETTLWDKIIEKLDLGEFYTLFWIELIERGIF